MLQFIKSCWAEGSDNEVSASLTASELLRIGLMVPSIAHETCVSCIDAIQTGQIVGRAAIFCVSEIRLCLVSLASIEMDESILSIKRIAERINDIAVKSFRPFLTDAPGFRFTRDLQSSMVCLELLPHSIGILCGLRKRFLSLPRLYISRIDDILNTPWTSRTALPFANLICDLFLNLKSRHVREFKVRGQF